MINKVHIENNVPIPNLKYSAIKWKNPGGGASIGNCTAYGIMHTDIMSRRINGHNPYPPRVLGYCELNGRGRG